ncbi:MAG: sugar ABC transporter permease [Phycisphaeraceae bacterium]
MSQTQTAGGPVAAGATPLGGIKKRRRSRLRRSWVPLGFLLPYFLVTAVFFLYPLGYATVLSFYMTSGPGVRRFVGLDNFLFVLGDGDFHRALYNTAFFAVCSVCIQLPLSFGLAMMLNAGRGRLKGFFRLAIFAPNLVGQAFVAILFTMLFTPRYGLFNRLVHMVTGFGLEQQWLTDPRWVMPAVVIAALWLYVGFNMIYFLAALQNVSRNLIEAAWIDGAGPWGVFWNVTRPAVTPVATFVVVMSTIGSFQLFELPYILLQGYGPKNSGMTVVGYLYSNAFENGDLGTAAAVGWLLTLIVLGISLVQIKLSGTMENDG